MAGPSLGGQTMLILESVEARRRVCREASSSSAKDVGPGLPFSEPQFPCWTIFLLGLRSLGMWPSGGVRSLPGRTPVQGGLQESGL